MKQMARSAMAVLRGGNGHPAIRGTALFEQREDGVLVTVQVMGLPRGTGNCDSPIFAMHIHDGPFCSGNATDAFADAGMHLNPHSCPHPYHAGDLPPLFGCNGHAYMAVLTDRFTLDEVVGRPLIIHAERDDFTTQPSGGAGTKIACGLIRWSGRR